MTSAHRSKIFDAACERCPRLASNLREVRTRYPDYHAAPVAPFGDERARFVVVGLAPGLHGANATGRPFTGDHAGILLYETLHAFGFASTPVSRHVNDGLRLRGCRITNAVKCVPPQNKPTTAEIACCNSYLAAELRTLGRPALLFALGGIAHRAVLRALGLRQSAYAFAHGAEYELQPGLVLLDCYHCSRYNTQTRRLTPDMFRACFARARELLGSWEAASA